MQKLQTDIPSISPPGQTGWLTEGPAAAAAQLVVWARSAPRNARCPGPGPQMRLARALPPHGKIPVLPSCAKSNLNTN